MQFLPNFMESTCSPSCGVCGTPFQSDIVFDNATHPTKIIAARFRGQHANMPGQQNFIDGLKAAYNITDTMREKFGVDIFPYSVFYVFFEQYLYIENVALLCIGLASGMLLS
jgi:Niemann-Pick C1 protein